MLLSQTALVYFTDIRAGMCHHLPKYASLGPEVQEASVNSRNISMEMSLLPNSEAKPGA